MPSFPILANPNVPESSASPTLLGGRQRRLLETRRTTVASGKVQLLRKRLNLLAPYLRQDFHGMHRVFQHISLAVGLLVACVGTAQLDTAHWVPPLHSRDNGQINDHYLYLSTPETSPVTVNLYDGSGSGRDSLSPGYTKFRAAWRSVYMPRQGLHPLAGCLRENRCAKHRSVQHNCPGFARWELFLQHRRAKARAIHGALIS